LKQRHKKQKLLGMKNKMLLWTILLISSVSTTFAGTTTGVDDKIVNSFKKDFASAQEVQWEKNSSFTKATFKLSGQVMFAYYSTEGNLLAISRNITSSQLPISLMTELKKNYRGYWISDLFEMVMSNETSYYITLENGDQKLVLKSHGGVSWDVYKKEKKDVQ
jgi:hypothetical protein